MRQSAILIQLHTAYARTRRDWANKKKKKEFQRWELNGQEELIKLNRIITKDAKTKIEIETRGVVRRFTILPSNFVHLCANVLFAAGINFLRQ